MTNTQGKKIRKAGKGLFDKMDRWCNRYDVFTAAFKNLISLWFSTLVLYLGPDLLPALDLK